MLLATLLISLGSLAAPHPATSSSALTDPAKGLFFKPLSFEISKLSADLIPAPKPADLTADSVQFTVKNSPSASFSVRIDALDEDVSLETYARRWMREYPNYGFEVLGTRALNFKGGRALVVDMTQQKKNQQLRQVVLRKDRRVAIITCFEAKARFKDILSTCNSIAQGFSWR